MLDKVNPFTDQEPFPVSVKELIAQYDNSPPYEKDAGAIFRTMDGKYLGVVVSGCS